MSHADRVVIDARFLHHTGVGRVTRTMLNGLSELDLLGPFAVWGDEVAASLVGPNIEHIPYAGRPLAWAAQRDSLFIPSGRLIYLHGFRPLLSAPALATFILDTIPIRHEPSTIKRQMFRLLLRVSARRSQHLLTISEASAERIRSDLASEAVVVRPALDLALARCVAGDRSAPNSSMTTLLYVGQGKRYKNVEGAIEGFRRSEFAASGGRFEIVGPDDQDADRLRRAASDDGRIVVLGRVDEQLLRSAYSRARAVIQPSLEEGFGLTVIEALAAGIPVCCSDRPALREAAAGRAQLFDPTDANSIAKAVDRTMAKPLLNGGAITDEVSPAEFAAAVLRTVGLGKAIRDLNHVS